MIGGGKMYGNFPPYVSAAERRRKAEKAAAKMAKNGEKLTPIRVNGRAIAKTFWGKSWCDHLESFSDYENRLPRGRTYVRNGSVIHLSVEKGKIEALVQGSSLYKIKIDISCAEKKRWRKIIEKCSDQIDSVIELLQGKLSSSVMKSITDKQEGLFPQPKEISFSCSCPDSARMCKHIAAVLYGVGARLDQEPELLFKLRHVDHLDLINKATFKAPTKRGGNSRTIKEQDLSSLFGIEIESEDISVPKEQLVATPKRVAKTVAKKLTRKLQTRKKSSGSANRKKT